MNFVLFILVIILNSASWAQSKEDKRTFDSWTVGLRQNKSSGMPENFSSKDRLTFQGGFLKKNYYILGEGLATVRAGVLAVMRDAEIENNGEIYTANRWFLDLPVTINYSASRDLDVYLGVVAAIKISTASTGPSGFKLEEEKSILFIPTFGFDYEMGGWRLGYFIEPGVHFSKDWRQSAMGFTGKFKL